MATLHRSDGTTTTMRSDVSTLFVGRAEAEVIATGVGDTFPDAAQQQAVAMIGDRLLRADTA